MKTNNNQYFHQKSESFILKIGNHSELQSSLGDEGYWMFVGNILQNLSIISAYNNTLLP